MPEIDFKKIKLKRDYVFGATFSNGAERQYKYTIEYPNNALDGKIFKSATWTPRRGQFNWGKGETKYFFEEKGEEFDTMEKCIEALYKKTLRVV